MEVLFKNQSVLTFLTEVLAEWADLRPASYATFKRIVAEEHGALIKPSAMSADGCFLNYCKLPADLYAFIKREYRRRFENVDFFADPANYRLLCQVGSDLRVRRTPTNHLRIKPTDY